MIIPIQIAKFLNSSGVGVFSETSISGNIFINFLPENFDNICIAIFTRVGMPSDGRFSYREPKTQIIVRGQNQIEVEEKALEIHDTLFGFGNDFLVPEIDGGNRIIGIRIMQPPHEIGRDKKERYEFSFNMLVEYVK